MRSLIYLILTLMLFSGIGFLLFYSGDQKTVSKNLPQGQNTQFDPSVFEGKKRYPIDRKELLNLSKGPIIVNFWASWCEPCVQETPDLLELMQKFPDLKIIFISADSNENDLKAFLKSFPSMNSVRSEVIWDEDKKLMQNFDVNLLPESFIYDQNLVQIRHIRGAINWKTLEFSSK